MKFMSTPCKSLAERKETVTEEMNKYATVEHLRDGKHKCNRRNCKHHDGKWLVHSYTLRYVYDWDARNNRVVECELLVRRMLCTRCSSIHNIVPDSICPYENHTIPLIFHILNDIVKNPEHLDDGYLEMYHCTTSDVKRWIKAIEQQGNQYGGVYIKEYIINHALVCNGSRRRKHVMCDNCSVRTLCALIDLFNAKNGDMGAHTPPNRENWDYSKYASLYTNFFVGRNSRLFQTRPIYAKVEYRSIAIHRNVRIHAAYMQRILC